MPAREFLVDGDQGFIGLNSRDNPLNLGKNFVSKSQNFRFDRGVATLRKGLKRLTDAALEVNGLLYGACTYTKADGTEQTILVYTDRIVVYDLDTNAVFATITFPPGEVITAADIVDVYQAQGIGYVYICRGYLKSTLRWNGTYVPGSVQIPGVLTHHNYPPSVQAIYYNNRHIVQTDQNTFKVSHYLTDNTWSSLDMFSINDGSSDSLVSITPWTLNEFVVFMRNSVFYVSVGVGADVVGDPASNNDSYVKSLANDKGCIARYTAVQAAGGILFLSDNGVYMLNPSGASQGGINTPEGMRLLSLVEPLSAPVNDVISRINYSAADKAVAIYWENRYYLAIPIDSSTTNNAVLVYNFINKAWESVDSYPASINIRKFFVAKRGNKRRLLAIDANKGIFLLEELDIDEFGAASGLPLLPPANEDWFVLDSPSSFLLPSAFVSNQINGDLITRGYSLDTNKTKRYSSLHASFYAPSGGVIYTKCITTNPDVQTQLIRYGLTANEDFLLRLPIRKCAHYMQAQFITTNSRPEIHSTQINAIIVGYTNTNQK